MVEGFYPRTLADCLILRREKKDTMIIAGGTDIMVVKKKAQHMIFINRIDELKVVMKKGEFLRVGAAATYTDLIADERIPDVLRKAMQNIAAPAIRNAGTVGGNICNASPAGDTLPVLYVLSAVIVKASLSEEDMIVEQRIPIEDFILGIRKIELKENEIVTAIEIPVRAFENQTKVTYEKVGARQAQAISKLSFAALMRVEDETITDLRIAFGSVGITVIRRKELEEKLIGKSIKEIESLKDEILEEYAEYIRPIDDQRSTAVYRSKVCLNLLADFLTV